MSQPIFGLAPALPVAVCCVYSYRTFAKLRLTFSVNRSLPPDPPVLTLVTMTSSMMILRYSSGSWPALRTIKVPLEMCLPLHRHKNRSQLAVSMYFVKLRGWTVTLPASQPPPICQLAVWVPPQDHARTSISSLCLSSLASPLMPSNLRNISTAMQGAPSLRQIATHHGGPSQEP